MISSNFRVEGIHSSSYRGLQSRQRRRCRYCYGTSTMIVNQLDMHSKDVLKESGPEEVVAKDPFRGHRLDIRI